jgi:putative hydrolase of HD superfamily
MNRQERLLQWAVEAGLLKRVKRTGWWCSGVKDPESVAEHSHRMSMLAFYIASEDDADPYKAASLGLFHDLPEARIGDAHAVVKRYWKNIAEDEARARNEQNACLPEGRGRTRIEELGLEWSAGRTPEARAARDADYLECAIQAVEYFWQQKSVAREWVDSNVKRLQTRTGKRLGLALKQVLAKGKWEELCTWWKPIYQR